MNQQGVIKYLEEIRGYPLPVATFYGWLRVCGIVPKGRRLDGYDQDEVTSLARLAYHLKMGGGYKEFQDLLIEQQGKQDHDQTRTTTPIECFAQQA